MTTKEELMMVLKRYVEEHGIENEWLRYSVMLKVDGVKMLVTKEELVKIEV